MTPEVNSLVTKAAPGCRAIRLRQQCGVQHFLVGLLRLVVRDPLRVVGDPLGVVGDALPVVRDRPV